MTTPSTIEGWTQFFLDRKFTLAIAEQWAETALPFVRLTRPKTKIERQ
jgi:hypothetical protein